MCSVRGAALPRFKGRTGRTAPESYRTCAAFSVRPLKRGGVIGLTRQEQLDLVAFLESLTDPRVQCDQAPFDHPELLIPNGHPGDQFTVVPDPASLGTKALDSFRLSLESADGTG